MEEDGVDPDVVAPLRKETKRREGLVTEIIISVSFLPPNQLCVFHVYTAPCSRKFLLYIKPQSVHYFSCCGSVFFICWFVLLPQPRREEDEPVVSSNKKYREIKERLRRQKEKEIARKRAGSLRTGGKSGGGRERRKPKSADSDDANISKFTIISM